MIGKPIILFSRQGHVQLPLTPLHFHFLGGKNRLLGRSQGWKLTSLFPYVFCFQFRAEQNTALPALTLPQQPGLTSKGWGGGAMDSMVVTAKV